MKHAAAFIAGGEYTLCGQAFDAFESGDADEPVREAGPGQRVTCKECRTTIDHVKRFVNYIVPKD